MVRAYSAGGRAIIDGIKSGLGLSEADVKASRDVLHDYGNVSSSSIWYEFYRTEMDNKIQTGDKIWSVSVSASVPVSFDLLL